VNATFNDNLAALEYFEDFMDQLVLQLSPASPTTASPTTDGAAE